MVIPSSKEIEAVKKKYPPGTVIELVKMEDEQAPPVGTKGVVRGIDGIGSLLVNWENGCGLNVAYGEDEVKIIGDAVVDKGSFLRYVDVQKSGVTNMLSPDVQTLASITKEQHDYVLQKYSMLEEIYLGGE